jgi:hypothetical protein
MNSVEKLWKKEAMAYLKVNPSLHLDDLSKTIKDNCHNRKYCG